METEDIEKERNIISFIVTSFMGINISKTDTNIICDVVELIKKQGDSITIAQLIDIAETYNIKNI